MQNGISQPLWQLYQLHFETELIQLADVCSNSSFSVEAINRKVIPWLRSKDGKIQLCAGDSLIKFIEILNQNGTLYLPIKFFSDFGNYIDKANTFQQLVEATIYPQAREC